MKTVLDEAHTWFLKSLAYEQDLKVLVDEGVRSAQTEDLEVGDKVLTNLHPIEITAESRRIEVRFARVVAWQVVDESYTRSDDAEERDDTGFLSVLSKSAYLGFVNKHHGWYGDVAGPATHYRLWTENEVFDVVAHDGPVLQLVARTD